jgi:DNA helicase-2/ATP-dependent DNA helicase PcrA
VFADEGAALTEAQQRAVAHGDGPLVVIAGAGSGKTRTLVARVGSLLQGGVAPERLCLLTFSRRAASEMLGRLGPAGARVWGGTFHAVGSRFLRLRGRTVGLDPGFTVLDAADAVELMGLVRADGGFAADARSGGRRFPSAETLVAIASRSLNAQERLDETVTQRFGWCGADLDDVRRCLVAYTQRKRARHLLDLDDLLLFWRALVRHEASSPASRVFDAVLVDEYQDTCVLQADIVDGLCPDGVGLSVVGDDAQAIYGFRAATPRNILDFAARYPTATMVRLEANHRSTPQIVAVANAVMAPAAPGHSSGNVLVSRRPPGRRPVLRTCGDGSDEAAAVADRVLAHRDEGTELRRQAVLFRAAWHADLLELELIRRDIPYVKYGGLRFLQAAHVKDLLALLRVLDNPWDELAWGRTWRLLDGVGPTTAARLNEQLGLRATADAGAPTPLAQLLAAPPIVPPGVAGAVGELRTALAVCAAALAPGPEVACLRQFLDPVVRRRYDHADARLADLEQIEAAAARYVSRAALLTDLVLDPPSSTSELAGPPSLDDDWLTLSTVHSAKGGEWEVVHVIHASDGCFPSDMACGSVEDLEEERRLLYVACTRARTVLEVSWPLRYHHNRRHPTDAHSWAQRSRFLTTELRQLAREEVTAGAEVTQRPVGASTGGAAATAVDALLTELWG